MPEAAQLRSSDGIRCFRLSVDDSNNHRQIKGKCCSPTHILILFMTIMLKSLSCFSLNKQEYSQIRIKGQTQQLQGSIFSQANYYLGNNIKLIVIQLKMDQLKICLILLGLALGTVQLDWQAAGNWSQSNITYMWTYIDANIASATDYGVFVQDFSEYLNKKWDRAWNIYVAMNTLDTDDTVFYGYAYNDHWLWYNGLTYDNINYFTIIIWKDYNCQTWVTVDSYSSISPNTNWLSNVGDLTPQASYDNIWLTAKNRADAMQGKYGGAFSCIYKQNAIDTNFYFYARICMVGDHYLWTDQPPNSDGNGNWGFYLTFQTREY